MSNAPIRSFLAAERSRLVNYVRRIATGSDIDAEDVVQDVIVRLFERGSEAPPLDQLAAYTFRALRNRVIDLNRRTRMDSVDASADNELLTTIKDESPDALARLQTAEGQRALFDALTQLSDIERLVVTCHEFEGVKFRDLSDETGLPVNTLLSHKARAIRKLRKHLLNHGGML